MANSSLLKKNELGARTFVFLCGLHRSGTSLLFKMLREHPEISGFKDTGVPEDEGQHLQTVYPTARCFGGPGKFGFRSGAYLNADSDLITDANRSRLISEWGRYWDLTKPFLLEKSPPNLIRTLFLQRMFPGSVFITIIRHPIPTSYATKKWSRTGIRSLIEHWLVCHEKYMEDAGKIANAMWIRYEDLVEAPEVVLKKVYETIGTYPVPTSETISRNINDHYFEIWRQYRKTIPGRWQVKRIISRFEHRVNRFGYTLL